MRNSKDKMVGRNKRKKMDKTLSTRSAKEVLHALKSLLPYIANFKMQMIVVVIAMLVSVSISVAIGFGLRNLIDKIPTNPEQGIEFLDTVLTIVVYVVVISAIVKYISTYILQNVAARISENIRCDIFNNIVNNNLAYIEGQNSGDMQTRIVADTNAVGRFLTMQIPIVLTAILSLIGGVLGALFISARLTIIVLIFAPLIFLPFLIFAKRLRFLGERVQHAISNVGRFSGEAFRNIKVMKAYNKEIEEKQKFSKYAARITSFIMRSLRLSLTLRTVIGAVASIATAVLLWHVAQDIYQGTTTIGQLLAFTYFAKLIVSASQQFVGVVTSINVIVGKAQKVIEFLKIEKHAWPSPVENFIAKGAIEFSDVSFVYPNRPKITVLNGVNFSIKPGSHVAIVGSSGAGKSTVFDLILRLYSPQQGDIYFDGINCNDLSVDQIRSYIGFVPQKESLISGTVYENISYGTSNADEQSVKAAAEKAYADEFIERLPKGYHTDLGEIGNRLSGGQKQRISLARALIRNPQILLLDEANSALDSESDRLVSKAIQNWAKTQHKTVLSIAHRLTSARDADLIIVMNQGVVAAYGKHDDLIENSEIYRNLSFMGSTDKEQSVLEAV